MTGVLFEVPVRDFTKADQIRRAVKAAIITGMFPPGEKITGSFLAAQSGASPATVAPVMRALIEEGFLVRAGRDASVAIVTSAQGAQAVETLRLIAAAITPTGSESGRVLLDHITVITGTHDPRLHRTVREAFTRAAAECANPTLAKTLTSGIDGLLWRAGHAPTPDQLDIADSAGSPW